MKPAYLIVAKNGDLVNRFEMDSMLRALNIRDYLEDLGDYQQVSIYQLALSYDSDKRWVPVESSGA